MIDLHSHSTASDGSLSPSELVAVAAQQGLKALALTDHDTIAGVEEAAHAARSYGIEFIAGIELEIGFVPGEFHLLGYGLRSITPQFVHTIAYLNMSRDQRNHSILELCRAAGYPIQDADLKSQGAVLGRFHIANLMVEHGIVKTKYEAFDKYLGKGKLWYQEKQCLTLLEGLALIQGAGGLAVVAHPMTLQIPSSKLGILMDEWKKLGIHGIEAWHPGASVSMCRRFESMARKRGLAITAGSDFHGIRRTDRKLGRTAGDIPIKDSYLDEIRQILEVPNDFQI